MFEQIIDAVHCHDSSSKSEVSDVIRTLGFSVIDLDDLAYGSKLQQAKGAVATLNLIQS